MAETSKEYPNLPAKGKVQEVRKQWAVHEDGALAYQMQNQEINQHYGLNRFHRQMVREDIPVAKFVQSEEELQQQEERMRQLEILNAQAEEDARVAKKISRQMKQEVRKHDDYEVRNHGDYEVRNHGDDYEIVDDEELARQLQEREKKKYEKHLERKKERKLKKERQLLEAALTRDLEEARLTHNSETGSDRVSASPESLHVQGVSVTRITPSGCIEDEGDFSDFYNLPVEMDEFARLEIQATQDEELARLLQEQEHKRTKATVDQEKLRKIELQDEQLAHIMQEQEKLRQKKAKERHRARKEVALRQTSAESMPLGASANSVNQQRQLQQIPSNSISASIPLSNSGHSRYRSSSYTKACDSPPSPPSSTPPQHLSSDRAKKGHRQPNRLPPDQNTVTKSSNGYEELSSYRDDLRAHQVITETSPSNSRHFEAVPARGVMTEASPSNPRHFEAVPARGVKAEASPSNSRHFEAVPARGVKAEASPSNSRHFEAAPTRVLTTLESARQIAAGNPEGILAIQPSQKPSDSQRWKPKKERATASSISANSNIQPQGNVTRSTRDQSDPHKSPGRTYTDAAVYSQPYKPHSAATTTILVHSDNYEHQSSQGSNAAEGSHPRNVQLQQPSKSRDYSSEEDSPHHNSYPSDQGPGFNIAAAIDPTYNHRRHPEASYLQETQPRSQRSAYTLSNSDEDRKWDPNHRGSLRKTKAQVHGYQDSSTADSQYLDDIVAVEQDKSAWQPVQGQRRDPASRNKHQKQNMPGNDGKGNCKQQ